MLIDTHTHLYDEAFTPDGGGKAAVGRAMEAGIGAMVIPNVDLSTIAPVKELTAQFPGILFPAMGLHPTEVRPESLDSDLKAIRRALSDDCVAVGEIGMDLYWSREYALAQADAFDRQCSLAREKALPVIIHCREALDHTLEVLESHRDLPVVFHSFGGSREDVKRVRALMPEAYFGINGIVTFKNSGLRDVLPEIGIEKILLETDSPYLAPVPKRGRRNETAYLPYICTTVADTLGLSFEAAAEATTANARRLFRLQPVI